MKFVAENVRDSPPKDVWAEPAGDHHGQSSRVKVELLTSTCCVAGRVE